MQPKSAVYHSEVEDSAETSSEEPDLTRLQGQEVGSIAQPKYIRFLDKVAQSKYFQQVSTSQVSFTVNANTGASQIHRLQNGCG